MATATNQAAEPDQPKPDRHRFRLTPEQLDRAAAEARRLLQVQSEFAATAAAAAQGNQDSNRFRLTPEEWEMAVKGAKDDLEVLGRLQANRPMPQTPDQDVLSRLA